MSKKKTSDNNTGNIPTHAVSNIPIEDDGLLHAVDSDGQVVKDDAYLASAERAHKIEPLSFEEGDLTHKVEVRASQVSWKLTRQARSRRRRLLLQAYRESGIPVPDNPKDLTAEETQQIGTEFLRISSEDQEFQLLWAQIAIEAVVRDDQGRLRISVPQWREGVKPEELIDCEAGVNFVNAVVDFLP